MSADNLAIVFSPTLLRFQEAFLFKLPTLSLFFFIFLKRDKTDKLDPIKIITEQAQINKIIQYFISRYEWICLVCTLFTCEVAPVT